MKTNEQESVPKLAKRETAGGRKPSHQSDRGKTLSSVSRNKAMRAIALAVLAFGLMTNHVAAADHGSQDARPNNQWLEEHLLNDKAPLPFSFAYDRQGSSALLKSWPKKIATKQLDSVRTEHSVFWTDPQTGLQVQLRALEFADSPVVEWTVYFKNDGKVDAPILEYVQALDLSFSVTGEGIPTVLYSKETLIKLSTFHSRWS
jgi:hypothetical protein